MEQSYTSSNEQLLNSYSGVDSIILGQVNQLAEVPANRILIATKAVAAELAVSADNLPAFAALRATIVREPREDKKDIVFASVPIVKTDTDPILATILRDENWHGLKNEDHALPKAGVINAMSALRAAGLVDLDLPAKLDAINAQKPPKGWGEGELEAKILELIPEDEEPPEVEEPPEEKKPIKPVNPDRWAGILSLAEVKEPIEGYLVAEKLIALFQGPNFIPTADGLLTDPILGVAEIGENTAVTAYNALLTNIRLDSQGQFKLTQEDGVTTLMSDNGPIEKITLNPLNPDNQPVVVTPRETTAEKAQAALAAVETAMQAGDLKAVLESVLIQKPRSNYEKESRAAFDTLAAGLLKSTAEGDTRKPDQISRQFVTALRAVSGSNAPLKEFAASLDGAVQAHGAQKALSEVRGLIQGKTVIKTVDGLEVNVPMGLEDLLPENKIQYLKAAADFIEGIYGFPHGLATVEGQRSLEEINEAAIARIVLDLTVDLKVQDQLLAKHSEWLVANDTTANVEKEVRRVAELGEITTKIDKDLVAAKGIREPSIFRGANAQEVALAREKAKAVIQTQISPDFADDPSINKKLGVAISELLTNTTVKGAVLGQLESKLKVLDPKGNSRVTEKNGEGLSTSVKKILEYASVVFDSTSSATIKKTHQALSIPHLHALLDGISPTQIADILSNPDNINIRKLLAMMFD